MAKLMVVCGHGAGDPGAGGYGYTEAERVRTLAAEMKRLAGDEMILGDTNVNWYASNAFSYLSNPGCPVIELHMDSASAQARGAHVIIASGLSADAQDQALASWCGSFFPGRSNTIVSRSDLKNPNVCRQRGINYRLLECGFISNMNDLAIFNANIPRIASDILNIFGIAASAEPIEPVTTEDHVDLPPAPMVGSRIYRLYNPKNGDHLFTDDTNEVETLTKEGDWTSEGERWYSADVSPVYRLYNKISGLHFFTANYEEAKELCESEIWVFERIAWYAINDENSLDAMPVNRLYNPQSDQHILSEEDAEIKELANNGWNDEGLAFIAKSLV